MTAARSFRAELIGLRDSLAPVRGQGVATFHPVVVRPSLGFALVPKPREKEDRDADPIREPFGPRPRYRDLGFLCGIRADVAAHARSARLGLSMAGDSTHALDAGCRKGLEGLTRKGAQFLEDFCALIREDRYCYGLWTVTLPHEVAQHLDSIPDGAQAFGDAIRRRFGEALRRACAREGKRRGVPIPDHWAFVIEPQKAGRPHWHFVFRCKARRGTGWLLGKGALDRLIRNAFRTVTGTVYPVKAAGNVQAILKDPGSYLSSYLKKGVGATAAETVLLNGWSLWLVPHQWWGCSRSALLFVRAHIWELPRVAVNWLSREWPTLAAAGVVDARIWQPDAGGAPAIVCGRWRSLDRLMGVLDHLLALAETPYPMDVLQSSGGDCT